MTIWKTRENRFQSWNTEDIPACDSKTGWNNSHSLFLWLCKMLAANLSSCLLPPWAIIHKTKPFSITPFAPGRILKAMFHWEVVCDVRKDNLTRTNDCEWIVSNFWLLSAEQNIKIFLCCGGAVLFVFCCFFFNWTGKSLKRCSGYELTLAQPCLLSIEVDVFVPVNLSYIRTSFNFVYSVCKDLN